MVRGGVACFLNRQLLTGDRLLVDHETLPSPFERSAPSLQLHGVTSDTKDVDLTIRLASEAEQATIIDGEEIEHELRALVQEVEAEKLADKERAALDRQYSSRD